MSKPNTSASAALPMVALALAGFAVNANLRLMDPLVQHIGREYQVSLAQAAQIITVFSVGYGFSQMIFGVLADRFGKLRVIFWLCAASVFTSALCALSASLAQLTIARLFAGMAASGIIPVTMALIGDTVDDSERGATLARYMSGGVFGSVLGQIAGGIAADTVGWRLAPVLLSALFIFAFVALFRHATGKAAAVKAETRVSPLTVIRSAFKNPAARATLILVTLEGFIIFGTLAYIGADLQQRLGMSAAAAGLCLGCFALGSFTYLFWGQKLLLRITLPQLLLVGGAVYCSGIFLLSQVETALPAAVGIAGGGFGFSCLHNYLQTRSTRISPAVRGTGVALFASTFFLGQAAGVWAVAKLIPISSFSAIFNIGGVVVLLLSCVLSAKARASD